MSDNYSANRIVLVGFPGAGKTTIAKSLAKILNYKFIDLDQEVEKHFHTTISIFIQKYGEDVFRKCEHALLKEILLSDNCVISTGGGTPCFHNAMDLINATSLSVYIKMSKASLHTRLTYAKKKRPLVQEHEDGDLMTYIETTLSVREEVYNQAAIIAKGESINVRELAQTIKINDKERIEEI